MKLVTYKNIPFPSSGATRQYFTAVALVQGRSISKDFLVVDDWGEEKESKNRYSFKVMNDYEYKWEDVKDDNPFIYPKDKSKISYVKWK